MVDTCQDNGANWPRDRHPLGQMALDTNRNRLYVYGGANQGCVSLIGHHPLDTWYLSLNADPSTDTWHSVSTAGSPNPDMVGTAAHDPVNDVIVHLGGSGFNLTWVFCPTTSGTLTQAQTDSGCTQADHWTDLTSSLTPQPSGRYWPSMVYSPEIHKIIVYGGWELYDNSSSFDTRIWTYDVRTKTWTALTPTGTVPPAPATYHDGEYPAITYDSARHKILYHYFDSPAHDYAYDPVANSWEQLTTSGTWTGSAVQHTIQYDPVTDRVIGMDGAYTGGDGTFWEGQMTGGAPVHAGVGCTTAYFIDKDCDGYGVGKKSSGTYTLGYNGNTQGNPGIYTTGDLPDADDSDPTVSTTAQWQAKWGTTNAGMVNFLQQRKGFTNTSRVWYVSLTGNDSTGAVNDPTHPYATMAPIVTALHDLQGGAVIVRGGSWGTSLSFNPCEAGNPCYHVTGTLANPVYVMAYPGEKVETARGITVDISYWPNKTTGNVTYDGLTLTAALYGTGDGVSMTDADHVTFLNCEFVGWHQLFWGNHSEDITVKDNVFHDMMYHAVYFGWYGMTYGLNVDFDFVADAAAYTAGTSVGASYRGKVLGNVMYNNGSAGYEPIHVNTFIDSPVVEGNIVSYSGGTGIGLQTGVYHASVRNNVLFDNGVCAVTAYVYSADSATLRWNTIENNTIYVGNPSDVIRDQGPGCAVIMQNDATAHHDIRDFTIRNNVMVTYNSGGNAQPIFRFNRDSYPDTHVIQNNILWSNVGTPSASDRVAVIGATAFPDGHAQGDYNFTQFQAYGTNISGNLYANPGLTAAATTYTLTPELFNFTPLAGSPAIGAGTTTGAPTTDVRGLTRGSAIDIGAYEMTGDSSCSVSPTSLGPYTAGQSVSQQFTASNCATSTWGISGIAGSGLTLNSSTGLLTGTAEHGSYSLTIAYDTASQPITLTINYADITDKLVHNEAVSTPTLPTKNVLWHDPRFGTEIVRLTDDTDGCTISDGTWKVMNSDDTAIVLDCTGGAQLWDFDATTMQGSNKRSLPSYLSSTAIGRDWAFTNPKLINNMGSAGQAWYQYNIDTGVNTLVKDLSAQMGIYGDYRPTWSSDDNVVCFGLSNWNNSTDKNGLLCYDRRGAGTVHYLQQSTIVNDCLTSPNVPMMGCIAKYFKGNLDRTGRYFMHYGTEFQVPGDYYRADEAVDVVNATSLGYSRYDLTHGVGHAAMGHGFIAGTNSYYGGDIYRNTFNPNWTTSAWTLLLSPMPAGNHTTEFAGLPRDDVWFYAVNGDAKDHTPGRVLANEVYAVKTDGSGDTRRLLHTYHYKNTDDTDADRLYWHNPQVSVSWSGRFAFYKSDWMNTAVDSVQYVFVARTGLTAGAEPGATPGKTTVKGKLRGKWGAD
jgi:hypothetical protein